MMRATWRVWSAVAAALLGHGAVAQSVLPNGDFEQGTTGWGNPGRAAPEGVAFDWQKDGGRNGTGAIHVRIEGTVAERGPWIWSQSLDDLPPAKAYKLTAWVKGKGVTELASVCAQAWQKETDDMSGFATTQTKHRLSGDFDWKKAEAVLVPKEGTGKVIVMALVAGKGEAWFDDITLEPTEPPAGVKPGLAADNLRDTSVAGFPGLFMARGAMELTATKDGTRPRFAFPIPLCYREQVPLSFKITTKPEHVLERVTFRADTTGGVILEGELEPMAIDEKVDIRWESMLMVGPRSFDGLPVAAAIPDQWPEEARPWLEGTWCAGTGNDRIREIGERVRGDGKDVLASIDRACLESQAVLRSVKGRVNNLTADEALDHQGSCTSCANLVAAILRAASIPARVLSGYPTWSGPLQTHYVVEAYVPDYGWYPVESTMGKNPWPPFGQIAVRIIPPEDEGERAKFRFNAAGGVPYLSLTEYPGYKDGFKSLGNIDRRVGCDHEAERIRPLGGTAQEWKEVTEKARARWQEWVAKAVVEGGPRELAAPDGAGSAKEPAGLLQ